MTNPVKIETATCTDIELEALASFYETRIHDAYLCLEGIRAAQATRGVPDGNA